jgi:alpha-tubulin suppressor-like RCC1 family protein
MRKLLTILFLFPLLIKAQTYKTTDTIRAGTGEYNMMLIRRSNLLGYGQSGNPQLTGTNNTSSPGIPGACVTSPANQQMKSAWAALHGGYLVGTNGYIYVAGDNSDGQYGDGTSTFTYGTYKLTTDSAGNDFGSIVAVAAFYTGNAHNGALAIKADGTLWAFGNLTDAMRGNGTSGSTFQKPVQIAIPGGRSAIQVLAGFIGYVLCSDGTVWAFGSGAGSYASLGYAGSGNQYMTIHQCTGLTGITQIAGGEQWQWAYNGTTNKLYRFGLYGNYLGKSDGTGTGRGNPIATPEEATEVEAALGMPTLSIKEVVTNSDATAFILSDGTLHTCGEGAQGNIGNGQELNYFTYTYPFAFDLGAPGAKLQILPIQISFVKFKHVYGGSVFSYYFVAEDIYGNLWVWGRNKGLVIYPIGLATSDLVAQYPNSMDVLWPTMVDFWSITKVYYITSPWCLPNPGATYCSEFTHGPYHALSPNAGSDQTITATSANLSGSVGDTAVSLVWSIVSGPGSPYLLSNTDKAPSIQNLSNGTTIARLTVVNNGFVSYTDDVQIIVNTVTPCNCIGYLYGVKGRKKVFKKAP